MAYKLTRAEQETHITMSADTDTARIDTADPVMIRKLDRLAEEFQDSYRCTLVDSNYDAKKYEVDSRLIRFGKPASEARREAARRNASNLVRKPASIGICSEPDGEVDTL